MSITTNTQYQSTRATAITDYDSEMMWERGDGVEITWAARYLLDRAIAPEVAEARGYYTPETPQDWRLNRGTAFTGSHFMGNREYEMGWDQVKAVRPLGIPLYSLADADRPVCIQIRPEKALKVNEDVLDKDGQPVTIAVKRKDPVTGEMKESLRAKTEVKSLKFLAPAGAKRGNEPGDLAAPDVHPWAQDWLQNEDPDAPTPALFTEGVHKADAVLSVTARVGRPLVTLAVTGVTMGYHAPATAENPTRIPVLTPDMADVNWEGRTAFIAFDPDWIYKEQVGKAMLIMGNLLQDAGATVRIVNVPASDRVNGIDDYLVESDDAALWSLLDDAMTLDTATRLSTRYTRDDVGRGQRLADEMRQPDSDYKMNATTGEAIVWTGTHWVDDDRNAIESNLAAQLTERDPEDTLGRSGRALQAAVKQAKGLAGVTITSAELDQDPYLLNAQNGTIDLMTGELRPHNRADLITRVTPSGYDADAKAPNWDKFMLEICTGDTDQVSYMQRMAGQAAIGKITDPLVNILLGPGNNGKSLKVDMLRAALGGGYATTIQAAQFLGEATAEQVATLKGKRVLFVGEMTQGTHLNDGNLKTMTSSDEISGRQLYEKRITFVPTWSTIIPANHMPVVTAQDKGTWRRIRVVPMRLSLTDAEIDASLAAKLEMELPGILAWIVRGAIAFIEDGMRLHPCQSVIDETKRQRGSTDIVGDWLADNCVIDSAAQDDRMALYASFAGYVEGMGRKIMSQAALHTALIERNVVPHDTPVKKSGRIRSWPGLRLSTAVETEKFMKTDHAELDPEVPGEREQLIAEVTAVIESKRVPAPTPVKPAPAPQWLADLLVGWAGAFGNKRGTTEEFTAAAVGPVNGELRKLAGKPATVDGVTYRLTYLEAMGHTTWGVATTGTPSHIAELHPLDLGAGAPPQQKRVSHREWAELYELDFS